MWVECGGGDRGALAALQEARVRLESRKLVPIEVEDLDKMRRCSTDVPLESAFSIKKRTEGGGGGGVLRKSHMSHTQQTQADARAC